MFEALAIVLFQIATLLGTPAHSATASNRSTTSTPTNFATSTTTTPAPVSTIGNTGWDND